MMGRISDQARALIEAEKAKPKAARATERRGPLCGAVATAGCECVRAMPCDRPDCPLAETQTARQDAGPSHGSASEHGPPSGCLEGTAGATQRQPATPQEPTVAALLGSIRAHGCCMEDYGELGQPDVIAEGRRELDRLLAQLVDAAKAEALAGVVPVPLAQVEALAEAVAQWEVPVFVGTASQRACEKRWRGVLRAVRDLLRSVGR